MISFVHAIHELRPYYPLPVLLEVSGMARSSYYYHIGRMKCPDKYEHVRGLIFHIFHKHKKRYGYRRITAVLQKEGVRINHKTVCRLMNEMGLSSDLRHKKHSSYKGETGKIAPNILMRNFNAEKPLQKLVTDVTEFNILGRKIYLSPIMDLFNREILSYSISLSPNMKMINDMLEGLYSRRKIERGTIIHSDQGTLYQSFIYQKNLADRGIIQSMSRKATCLDNAVIENFFGILKSEMFYGKNFESIEQFTKTLEEYLIYYNEERIKIKLGGLSPIQYRLTKFAS